MEYYSKIKGTWNGLQMENIKGEIKIPNKIKRYIEYPIQSILIHPDSYTKIKDDNITQYYSFEIDTLSLNKEYNLTGTIIKVIDKKPMINVKIRK